MGKYTEISRNRLWPLAAAVAAVVATGCAQQPAHPTAAKQAPATERQPVLFPIVGAGNPLPGRPVALRDDAPLSYVVKRGDTLWGIASHFLLDPWQWPEIWYVNDQVRNPHHIFPGDVLKLVWADGNPRLETERLDPEIRETTLDSAIPAIPMEAIREFLRGPRLVSLEELQNAPYILAFASEHIIGGSGNKVYLRNLPSDTASGAGWAVVRKGDVYRDPDDGAIIGYEATPIGEAVVDQPGEVPSAVLSKTYREALPGDRLLPTEPEDISANIYPHAPGDAIGGRIIAVFDGVSQIGQYQIVALNRGSQHGLETGHVLNILQAGGLAKDPNGGKRVQLPDQLAGQLLVFKTTPRLSYGLVMRVTRPAHVLDKVETPLLIAAP